jgi:hypothetical protein
MTALMSKRFYAAFVPLLAVVAFVAMPATSQAAFHWYKCQHEATATHKFSDSECQKAVVNTGNWEWVRLPFTSAKTQVITFGKLTLTVPAIGITITCKVLDAGNIWNVTEPTVGRDNIEVYVNYECSSAQCATLSITAQDLPWETELAAGPIDKIGTVAKPIEITFNCAGTVLTYKGQLSPKVVNSTETEPTFEEFTAETGELEEPTMKLKMKVEGKDRILGFEHGEDIQVRNP